MCQQSRATVLICRVTMGYWKTCEGLQQQSAINNSMSQPGSGQPAIPSSGNRCFFDVCWAQFAPPFWVVLCRLLLFVTEMVMFLEKAPAPSSFGEDRPVSPVCRPSLVVDPCCLCCFYHNSACLHHFIRYAAFQAQPGTVLLDKKDDATKHHSQSLRCRWPTENFATVDMLWPASGF